MLDEQLIQDEKTQLQLKINQAQAVKRLFVQQDFVQVFEMGYFTHEVLRLHKQMANHLKGSQEYEQIVQALDTISSVQRYLQTVINDGAMAQEQLAELNAIPLSEYE